MTFSDLERSNIKVKDTSPKCQHHFLVITLPQTVQLTSCKGENVTPQSVCVTPLHAGG